MAFTQVRQALPKGHSFWSKLTSRVSNFNKVLPTNLPGLNWRPCYLARLIRIEWLIISLLGLWSGTLLIAALQ